MISPELHKEPDVKWPRIELSIVLMANQVTNSLLFFVLCILILFYLETNPKNYDVEEHEIKILIEQKRRESNMTVEEIRIMRESERKQMV